MDYFWIGTGLFLLIIICLFLLQNADIPPAMLGMWVGSPKFLSSLGLYYLGTEITKSNFIIDVQALKDGPIITQKYSYDLEDKNIIFKSVNVPPEKAILPAAKLELLIEGNQLAVVDKSTTYLLLTKFR